MTISKKDRFRAAFSGKTYEVACRWGTSLVLAPVDDNDDTCLVYETGEVEEMIATGRLIPEGGVKL
ncbi:MAG: hypothetical protein SCK57_09235 [Bacillota bacterium]|nr:hypothetical protein [Bacillota bacterium]MDW7677831.1 hypothetical protein [Bacillota bacterium]